MPAMTSDETQFSCIVPKDLKRQLRHDLISQDISMRDWLAACMRAWLERCNASGSVHIVKTDWEEK